MGSSHFFKLNISVISHYWIEVMHIWQEYHTEVVVCTLRYVTSGGTHCFGLSLVMLSLVTWLKGFLRLLTVKRQSRLCHEAPCGATLGDRLSLNSVSPDILASSFDFCLNQSLHCDYKIGNIYLKLMYPLLISGG